MDAPDLTQHPPRSPRARLGGYALLPRMLDKGRASIAGRNGQYQYACPLDERLLDFLGIDPDALKTELTSGKGDGEILAWIVAHQRYPHSDAEIAAWSRYQEQRTPNDPETREFFNSLHREVGPERDDIESWADLLDLDDFVSFGGRP